MATIYCVGAALLVAIVCRIVATMISGIKGCNYSDNFGNYSVLWSGLGAFLVLKRGDVKIWRCKKNKLLAGVHHYPAAAILRLCACGRPIRRSTIGAKLLGLTGCNYRRGCAACSIGPQSE